MAYDCIDAASFKTNSDAIRCKWCRKADDMSVGGGGAGYPPKAKTWTPQHTPIKKFCLKTEKSGYLGIYFTYFPQEIHYYLNKFIILVNLNQGNVEDKRFYKRFCSGQLEFSFIHSTYFNSDHFAQKQPFTMG